VDEWNDQNSPEDEHPDGSSGLFGRMNNWLLLIYAIACFMMASSLVGILYLNGNVVLSVILPGIVGYVFPLLILTRRYNLSFTGEFRLTLPDAATALLVLVIAAAAIYPVDSITWLMRRGRPVDENYIKILLAFKPKGPLHFAGMAIGLGLVTPLGEELLFRGVIQSVFHRNMTAVSALLLSALVFAVSHQIAYLIPGATALGLILGYVFYRTGILTCAVAIHAVSNLFSLYRLNRISEETIRNFEWSPPDATVFALSTVILIAALILFTRLTAASR
jgi:membrane protease YdiL (CAAX protease family)